MRQLRRAIGRFLQELSQLGRRPQPCPVPVPKARPAEPRAARRLPMLAGLLTLAVLLLAEPSVSLAVPENMTAVTNNAGNSANWFGQLLAHTGPKGIDPAAMPALGAVHPLVIALLQVLVTLMAMIAFPVRKAVRFTQSS